MFTQQQSATKSYRAVARGAGCRWARTYQASQRPHEQIDDISREDAKQGIPQPRGSSPSYLDCADEVTAVRVIQRATDR